MDCRMPMMMASGPCRRVSLSTGRSGKKGRTRRKALEELPVDNNAPMTPPVVDDHLPKEKEVEKEERLEEETPRVEDFEWSHATKNLLSAHKTPIYDRQNAQEEENRQDDDNVDDEEEGYESVDSDDSCPSTPEFPIELLCSEFSRSLVQRQKKQLSKSIHETKSVPTEDLSFTDGKRASTETYQGNSTDSSTHDIPDIISPLFTTELRRSSRGSFLSSDNDDEMHSPSAYYPKWKSPPKTPIAKVEAHHVHLRIEDFGDQDEDEEYHDDDDHALDNDIKADFAVSYPNDREDDDRAGDDAMEDESTVEKYNDEKTVEERQHLEGEDRQRSPTLQNSTFLSTATKETHEGKEHRGGSDEDSTTTETNEISEEFDQLLKAYQIQNAEIADNIFLRACTQQVDLNGCLRAILHHQYYVRGRKGTRSGWNARYTKQELTDILGHDKDIRRILLSLCQLKRVEMTNKSKDEYAIVRRS